MATDATFNQQSTTFYWLDASSSRTVTYTVKFNNSTQSTAQLSFNVEGITGLSIGTTNSVMMILNSYVSFGDGGLNPGIVINIKAFTPPQDFSGHFSFTQIIESSHTLGLPRQNGSDCSAGPGLDRHVDYTIGNTLDDSPNILLVSPYTDISISDSFTSYIMWTPDGASTIAVPLGYVKWGFSGGALKDQGTGVWSTTPGGGISGVPSTTFGSKFPTWTGYVDAAHQVGINCQ